MPQAPAAVIRSKPSAVLPLVLTQIATALGWAADRIFLCLEPPAADTQAGAYVVVMLGDGSLNSAVFDGGGRFDDRVPDTLLVGLRTRLSTDEAQRATNWLLDATLGHLDLRHTLRSALSGFMPTDASGNALVAKPMRVQACKRPAKVPKAPGGWGESWLVVSLEYEADQVPGLG